jgi:hypothetical protein
MPQSRLIDKSLTEIVKPDLYGLFLLHAGARGCPFESESDADAVFSPDKGVMSFDIETISA